jgi:hypothetical protein
MGIGHGLADLQNHGQQIHPAHFRAGMIREDGGQIPALDQFRGEVGPSIGESPPLVDWDDARVLELSGDLSLPDEQADQVGPVAVLLEEDFDRQIAPQIGVSTFEDGPHTAPIDFSEDL